MSDDVLVGFVIAFVIVYVCYVSYHFGSRGRRAKTYGYRKNINDLIVVGKLRQYAEKKGIDLYEESDFFKSFAENLEQRRRPELDNKIEDEISQEMDYEEETPSRGPKK